MNYNATLKYHVRPAKGFVNDPNGLVSFRGYYHVFFQYWPKHEQPWKEAVCWGHFRTKDFLNWEELPIALSPDESYDAGGCWSGSAMVWNDQLYLFYSSVVKIFENGKEYTRQTVSMAFSQDGVHFEKHPANPVIAEPPADGCSENFRDPAILRIKDKFYLVLASSTADWSFGRLLLYESCNAVEWQYKGVVKEFSPTEAGLTERVICECPSFVHRGDEYLLSTSCANNDGGAFAISIGGFDGDKFVTRIHGTVQKGPDQYAGQIFADGKGRNILISWVGGWHWAKDVFPRSIGCMSLPMEIMENNGKILAYPVEEVRHLLKNTDEALTLTETGFVVKRSNHEDVVYEGPISDLKLLKDEYTLEVFINGGETVYAIILD